jgi:hypothetical protein
MQSSALTTLPLSSSKSSTPLLSQNNLHWLDRPADICDAIDKAFRSAASDTKSAWGITNGQNDYFAFGISQVALMKKIILEQYHQKKEFYFLDIGAGNFQSINHMSAELNADKSLPKDILVHCIGIRGERNPQKEIYQEGFCKLYQLGEFKIEWLDQAFNERNMDFKNKIDLIVSSWTFRHLIDPLGTFLQSYELLRSGSGLMLTDGWLCDLSFFKRDESGRDENISWILLEANIPFLHRYPSDQELDRFAILKSEHNIHLNLNLKYKAMHSSFVPCGGGSNKIIEYDFLPTLSPKNNSPLTPNFDNHKICQIIKITSDDLEMDLEFKLLVAPLIICHHPTTINMMINILSADDISFWIAKTLNLDETEYSLYQSHAEQKNNETSQAFLTTNKPALDTAESKTKEPSSHSIIQKILQPNPLLSITYVSTIDASGNPEQHGHENGDAQREACAVLNEERDKTLVSENPLQNQVSVRKL